ncbi:phage tail protein, partial [Streptomyces sp. OR43]|uniref:phage tail protein n=1 Tax=Streptomyces sp. or43 TaxID=2478957 RepID=UPI0013A2E158
SWVGADLDPAWPVDLRRAVVARAVELHRWRGTRRGLAEHLRLCFGVEADIHDGGVAAGSGSGAGAGVPASGAGAGVRARREDDPPK